MGRLLFVANLHDTSIILKNEEEKKRKKEKKKYNETWSLASRVQHTNTLSHTHTLSLTQHNSPLKPRQHEFSRRITEATAVQEPGFNPLSTMKKKTTTQKGWNLFVFLFTFYIFVHIVRGSVWGVGSGHVGSQPFSAAGGSSPETKIGRCFSLYGQILTNLVDHVMISQIKLRRHVKIKKKKKKVNRLRK